jgi:hypothetical protein
MRAVVLLLLSVMAVSVPARAQGIAADCPPIAKGERVDVETVSDGTIRGTLFCLSPDTVTVLRDGNAVTTPLSQVRRVVKPADPVWDGAVKGAAIVLTMWGVSCGFCDPDNRYMWRAVAGYALLGATFDGLQTHRKTIYVGKTAPSLNVRVRF